LSKFEVGWTAGGWGGGGPRYG